MIIMNKKELFDWQHSGWKKDMQFIGVYKYNEVTIAPYLIHDNVSDKMTVLYVTFNYKNMRGLLHEDNGYLGPQPDGKDFYPLIRVSPSLSDDCRFNPTVEPNLTTIASAIINVWNDFIKG